MMESLVKILTTNTLQTESSDLKDFAKGYEEFEKVCSMWNTFIYMHDYRKEKYLYISPTFCSFLGVNYNDTIEKGFDAVKQCIHPKDLYILENIVFKRIEEFLTTVTDGDENQLYRFSYSFRIKRKDGTYMQMSLLSKIIGFNKKGKILVDFGLITPVNHILQSEIVILHISKSIADFDYQTILREEYTPDSVHKNNIFTERELEIINLLKQGKNSNEICDTLFLSLHTVKNHRRNIFKKANVNRVTELITMLNKL